MGCCRFVGFYRKYDDVMRTEPGYIRSFKSTFTGTEFVHNRTWALEVMLPRWPGFCGRENASQLLCNLTAEEALCELRYVVYSIKFVHCWEDNQPESSWTVFRPEGFTDGVVAKVCVLPSLFVAIWLARIVKVCPVGSSKAHSASTASSSQRLGNGGERSGTSVCRSSVSFGS